MDDKVRENKKNNKIKIVLLVVILILLILILKLTYSKYVNESSATISESVGQWNIKINDKDITQADENGVTGEFVIDDFVWDTSQHVKSPKVAPGMTGRFYLKIDPTGTDVSIQYTILIDDSKMIEILNSEEGENTLTNNIGLKITGIKENGTEIELQRDENNNIIITRVKKLSQIQSENETDRIDNLEVEVVWENDEANNEVDSIIGSVANRKIELPIKVDVIQYTGE